MNRGDFVLWLIIGLFVILVLLVLFFIYYYNGIIVLRRRANNAWAQIDVQLKKRNDLVPNLVEIVRAYMKHEQKVMLGVAEARSALLKAKTTEEKVKASNMLTGALKTLFAVAENYPQLKANENFGKLQEEISDIENKIAYARQFYNDSVMDYNVFISTIPAMFFASMMGKKPLPYFKVEGEEREAPKVKFDV